MGAISDRLELSVDEVKSFLREYDDSKEVNTLIKMLIEAAKQAADAYCNNPFLDENGEEMPIPTVIKLWCLKWIARNYERRASGLVSEQVSGIGSVSWGEEDYSELHPYRSNPGT